jgi:hypothetical protein
MNLRCLTVATCGFMLPAGQQAFAQVLRGEAAIGGWRDDKPGVRRLLTPQDLPAIGKVSYGEAQVGSRPSPAWHCPRERAARAPS